VTESSRKAGAGKLNKMAREYCLRDALEPTRTVESPSGPGGRLGVDGFGNRLVCAGISGVRATGSKNCWIAILMVVACFWAPSFGQTLRPANSQVGHDFWGFKEGAPGDVHALAQTRDGFLWLGGPAGLFRFDGIQFDPFHSPFGDQLLSTYIFTLFAPRSGGLWIGYAFGGFSFLNDGKVTNYGGETASTTGNVRNFAQGKDGVVWAATSTGLWRFDHSHWQHIGPETGLPSGPIVVVQFDREGTLWALTYTVDPSIGSRLAYLRMGSRQFHMTRSKLFFTGFTLDAERHVMTSPKNKDLFDDTGINADDRPPAYPLFRRACSQIIDRTGSVWIFPAQPVVLRLPASELSSDAVDKASATKTETYDVNPYQSAELVDREGNVWLSDQKGLHRYFYSPLTGQALPKSAEGSESFTVTPDEDGAVWITGGTSVGKVFDIYLVGPAQVKARKGPGLVLFAYRGRDKTTWFGSSTGLWHLVRDNLLRVDLPREMADQAQFLQTITQDRSGAMWVSFGRHGLYRLADDAWTPYGGRQDLPKTGVLIEFTDSLSRVWFGYTKNTLAVLDGDRVQVFGPNDGLRVGNIMAIYGRGSEIWIGGEFGLWQFDHGRFHEIHATNEQWLRGISGIVETANGDLWLNGLGGIFHVRQSEMSEALTNSAYQVKGEHFGRRDGVPGVAFQARPLKSAIEGTDGRVWFTGSTGVAWLDPTRSEEKVPPPITIQSVSADDKSYQLASPLKFPAHTSSVQINYAAVSLSDPETIRFRYKLQETDKGWHEVSAADPVSYRNLAPGSYHFSVSATDINGAWSDKVATAEFTILPAFYQTAWFITLCIVSAITLAYKLYILRVRQLARQYGMRERLLQLEAELAHVNRVSMLGVMAASLAHEIKQPIAAAITSANSCIEWLAHEPPNLDRARAAAARIDKYGNRAAEIIDHIRSFYKKSPPQRELVNVNSIIQEILTLLQDEACKCSVVMRTDLSAELPEIKVDRVQLQQVFMNLILNGIEAMKDPGGELKVKSEVQDGQLQFSVSDTGVGLPAEKADQIFSAFFTTKPQGSGMGLAISRSIVESHGGQLWATANDGRGATFHFTLPVQTTESSPLVA